MRGLFTRATLVAAALALGASGSAYAQDTEKRLIKVTHPSEEAIHELEETYDVGYVGDHTEAAVYLDASEEAPCGRRGTRSARSSRTSDVGSAQGRDRGHRRERGARAPSSPRTGVDKSKLRGAVPPAGETVVMRAYTFTNYAGRFLYVEAHNKGHEPNNTGGPALQLSYAGPDGQFTDAGEQGTRSRTAASTCTTGTWSRCAARTPTSPTKDIDIRVAAATGSSDTATPIEWAGSALPPRIAAFQKDFITKYMDPTEVYYRIDALAAANPEIAEMVDAAEQHGRLPAPGDGDDGRHDRAGLEPGHGRAGLRRAAVLEGDGPPRRQRHHGRVRRADHARARRCRSPSTARTSPSTCATDATGALTSTAAQVRDAINAHPGASALVTAYLYNGNAGAGVVPVRARVQLSDYLAAPAHVKRGPFDQRILRIGKQRDGTKTGVFIYCQQHAREWVTPITCLETAERLSSNYATDPTTKAYVDNLDIFILPSVNPDGGHYSFYDFGSKRRNMSNYCPSRPASGNVGNRNNWGVDLNRNSSVGSLFDGYSGASARTARATPSPARSRSPSRRSSNEQWVADTFPKIKFSINIHTHGGYFMWAPGRVQARKPRRRCRSPNIGIENYFFDGLRDDPVAHHGLARHGAAAGAHGPVADTLYSAAGNSVDEQWYNHGIIAYLFEAGAQRIVVNPTRARSAPRRRLPAVLRRARARRAAGHDCGTVDNPDPLMVNEGHDQAMEFADGNYGLLQGALEYSQDVTAPDTTIEFAPRRPAATRSTTASTGPARRRSSTTRRTARRRRRTSPKYEAQGMRRPGEVLTLQRPGAHTVKWIAVDLKGNVSAVKTQRLLVGMDEETGTVGGTVPATLALTLGTPAAFGAFTPGVARTTRRRRRPT